MFYLLKCSLCGHRVLSSSYKRIRLEINRHYFNCHSNIKPYSAFEKYTVIVKIREPTVKRLMLAISATDKPPIKVVF
ncbi:MAG: hypothetical protein QXT14_02805 [Candidatus Bathyarchaeia archaeon]